MAVLPEIPVDSALARLFKQPRARDQTIWFSLPGGSKLFGQGDPSDQLYFVRTGRLGAFRREEGQESHFLGIIRPGEPAGEMALIAGIPHSADVYALRDSEIFAVPKDAFFEACDAEPAVMIELAKLMILRSRQTARRGPVGEPSVFGFVPVGRPGPVRPLVERLEREIAALGYAVTTVGSEAASAPTEWFSEVERVHDFVLYVAERDEPNWASFVPRQVDRLFRVGRGDRAAQAEGPHPGATTLQDQGLVDLILIQPADQVRPHGSEAWLDATSAARIFHIRRGATPDFQRMARVLTGQSVGLVLSGGGARAYAHVGAIKALRERGVPIDFVGGSSMGAIVGAGLAMGWGESEMDTRLHEAFVDTSPLDDIALPLLAMTHGVKVSARLAQHFDETQIADLWLPFFCLSSNLTTGVYQLHRRGLLRHALRASIALPGVMPPATDGQNVLVDGAVMKNFPADIMRAVHLGPIVGVDVTTSRSITAKDVARPSSVWRWIRSGQWRLGPPIVSLLMRTATVSTGRDLAAAREATDVLIQPDVSKIEIRDWGAYDEAVEAGYKATLAALDKYTRPIPELRRRASLREQAAEGAASAPFMASATVSAE
ncbi:MAG: patatin-like phospholipase family protein [Alphaproteobacteria bacterium]|nr:patatin-like phospholipase family protein [Alphaproteobacteria bacterium]MBU1512674.1 patatin-like phospholipase family protein [Alphaproteobacteria bacterium]MBU2095068.1 patatin-like phospholipase family protein [Alphaproteobacteria bacterium]MBU2151813.1 patatin-like phospholipase family protein [Alphaproteobacteria bacterium]MBU2306212.1 patatin-like phospholipase family protein [Alphaproteobacteria bacterium]